MIQIDGLDYGRRYRCQPLRITAVLRAGAQIVQYDPIYLDGLLARCAVDRATQGRGVANTPEPYDIPLPLECLWRDERGLPLWAASVFLPDGTALQDVAYRHKRAITGRYSRGRRGKLTIRSNVGRYMERRVPVPTIQCESLSALCIGDAEEIAHLLSQASFLGKERRVGFGEIAEWRIDETDEANVLVRDGCLAHAIPQGAAGVAGLIPQGAPVLVGWTPPQWKPPLFSLGWPVGTKGLNWAEMPEIDYFRGPG